MSQDNVATPSTHGGIFITYLLLSLVAWKNFASWSALCKVTGKSIVAFFWLTVAKGAVFLYHPVHWSYVAVVAVSETSGYATWLTAGGAIHIAHYDIMTRKL